MVKFNAKGTVRIFWDKADPTKFGLQINELEPPEKDPEINAKFAGKDQFGVNMERIGVKTMNLTDPDDLETTKALVDFINKIESAKKEVCIFAFVNQTEKGEYNGVFMSEPIEHDYPDMVHFDMGSKKWVVPTEEEVTKRKINDTKAFKESQIMSIFSVVDRDLARPTQAITKALLLDKEFDKIDHDKFIKLMAIKDKARSTLKEIQECPTLEDLEKIEVPKYE